MPVAGAIALALVASGAAGPQEDGDGFWRNLAGFDEAQMADAARGEVVTRVVPTREDNDVVVAGAVCLRVSKETLVAEVRDLRALTGARVVGVGRFSDPARVQDLDGLDFDRQELTDLRKCRPGDCDLKLGEAAMEIPREIDWKAPGASAAAEARLKQALVDAIEAYRARGTMAVYVDNERPEKVAEELEQVLEDSPHPAPDSALLRYVLGYPKESLPDAEDIFYWSKTKLQKPVVSLHHLVIQKDGGGPRARYNVADEHILDSHYFLGYLDVLTVTDRGTGAEGCYVTRLNRTRIDPPRFLRGALLRKVRHRMRELMGEDLKIMRARVEAERAKDRAP